MKEMLSFVFCLLIIGWTIAFGQIHYKHPCYRASVVYRCYSGVSPLYPSYAYYGQASWYYTYHHHHHHHYRHWRYQHCR